MTVLAFSHADCLRTELAGGKGASLARMAGLGLPVPPGFVLTAGCLAEALPDGGTQLRAILGRAADEAQIAAVAAQAQELVHTAELDQRLRAAVESAYAALGDGDPPVAVRSSACSEDGAEASFAGQQETYLHVRGAQDVKARIRDCWASFFTERALFYRAKKGSLDDLGMAVVVQRMVAADIAGVLFTIDTVRGRRDRMVVEAVFGLGEACVSGSVTPDHYVIKRDGTIKKQVLSVQPYKVVAEPEGGTQEVELTPEEGGAATLDEGRMRDLARIGEDLEARLGHPQDIEWAIEDGRMYVLQARPVTA
jgi:pyruvate,water dikinase